MSKSEKIDSKQAEKVKNYLETYCVGKNRAITAAMLADRTRIEERTVRKVVAHLIRKCVPIASSVGAPYGYFVPRTRSEASRCLDHLRSRVRETYLRGVWLQKGLQKKFGDPQLELGVEISNE